MSELQSSVLGAKQMWVLIPTILHACQGQATSPPLSTSTMRRMGVLPPTPQGCCEDEEKKIQVASQMVTVAAVVATVNAHWPSNLDCHRDIIQDLDKDSCTKDVYPGLLVIIKTWKQCTQHLGERKLWYCHMVFKYKLDWQHMIHTVLYLACLYFTGWHFPSFLSVSAG